MITLNSQIADNRIPIIVGVTGHRDLRNEDKPALKKAVFNILSTIIADVPNSPIILLSPLSEGADCLVAEVALSLGISLTVPLPLPVKEYEKDFTSSQSLAEFRLLMEKAELCFELSYRDVSTVTEKGIQEKSRDRCYLEVGTYIAKYSQILIALWDGVEKGNSVGTSEIVKYRLKGIPLSFGQQHYSLDPVESGPIYHVATPRISNPSPFKTPFSIDKIYPYEFDTPSQDINSYGIILKKIDEYNRDLLLLWPVIRDNVLKYTKDSSAVFGNKEASISLLNHYAASDALADYFQRVSYRSLLALLVLMVTGFSFFQFYMNIMKHPFFIILYFCFLCTAFIWHAYAVRREFQNKHLCYRSLGESFRIQIIWYFAGIHEDVSDFYLRKQKTELDWMRHAVRASNIRSISSSSGILNANFDGSLIHFKVILKEWVESQREYFIKSVLSTGRKFKKQERIANTLYLTGLCLSLIILMSHIFFHILTPLTKLIGLIITLSLAIATAIQGYMDKMAYSENIKEKTRMKDLFQRASRILKLYIQDNNIKEARNLVKDLGKEALRENGDWLLMHRSKPLNVPKGMAGGSGFLTSLISKYFKR